MVMTRTYRMKARAERHADTRRRIVEAALQLHRTAAPQSITVTEIARQAGVERPTVQRHFPDRIALLMACTFGDPVPAGHAVGWADEPNPEVRLSKALSEQYAWYRRNRSMLHYLLDLIEADEGLAPRRKAMWEIRNRAHRILSTGWPVREAGRPKLLLAIRHAFDFWAWLSLADSGLTDDEAVRFMVGMVRSVGSA
jgi:AcrR family transcriptional regulator